MGAQEFYTISFGRDVQNAFYNAKREANDYSGHRDGYSGDIQTKGTYKVIPRSEHSSKRNKVEYAEKLMDDEDGRVSNKWGPCGAIQITGDKEKRYRASHGLKGKRGELWLFFGLASC